jgi:hypothetical protein
MKTAIFVCRPGHYKTTIEDPGETVTHLTLPTPARRDAPFPMQRARVVQALTVQKEMWRVERESHHCKGGQSTRTAVCISLPFIRCGLVGRYRSSIESLKG